MATFSGGQGSPTYNRIPSIYQRQGQSQGQGQRSMQGPGGTSYGPGARPGHGHGQFRGAGDSILVGRGLLSQIKDLMQKVANATQQTVVAVQSQDPVPHPYVRELQEKQAQYLELLNKANKTALDQFYMKCLGLRIQELIKRVQTEQAAPKPVTIKEPTIQETIKESVPQVMQSKRRKNKGIEKCTSFDLGHFFEGEEKRARSASTPDAEDEDRTEEGGRNRLRRFRQSSGISVYKKNTPIAYRTRNRRGRGGVNKIGSRGFLRLPWLD